MTRWKGAVGVRCRGGLITDVHIYHVCKWHKDTEYYSVCRLCVRACVCVHISPVTQPIRHDDDDMRR